MRLRGLRLVCLAAVGSLCLSCGSAPCRPALRQAIEARIRDNQFADVEIAYSWTDGMGPGDIGLVIRGRGDSELTLRHRKEPARVLHAVIPAARIRQLLDSALASDLPCLVPEPRTTCLTDLGRYSLAVTVGAASHEIFYDGRTAVNGGASLDTLFAQVYGLSDLFGERFDWGPYGSTSGPCDSSGDSQRVEREAPD